MTYNTQLNQTRNLPQAQNRYRINPTTSSNLPNQEPPSKNKGLPLRVKAIVAAIAIGVIPVAVIGSIAYNIAKNSVTQQISQAQLDRTQFLATRFDLFLAERVKEAEVLASEQIFTNPNLSSVATITQKKAALNSFKDQIGFYDSIVYLDLQGNPLFQSRSEQPLRTNYGDRPHFRQAIATRQTTIEGPGLSEPYGQLRVELAVPVKHAWTDRVIGVMRFQIPGEQMNPLFTAYVANNEEWYLIDSAGVIFASSRQNWLNQPIKRYYPGLAQLHQTRQTTVEIYNHPSLDHEEQLITYAPGGMKSPNYANLGAALAIDTDIAFAPLEQLWWTFLGGTLATAALAGAVAAYLAARITNPIKKLNQALSRLSLGQFDTRVSVSQTDEISMLGSKINYMAEQLHNLVRRQKEISKTAELISTISQAASLRELQPPLNRFLADVRLAIKADRLVFFQFDKQWQGAVIAESVAQDWPNIIGVKFDDPCFTENYISSYQRGKIQAIADIYEANLQECYVQQLEPYGVIANLVVPVIADRLSDEQGEKLVGLLIAHQCSESRVWQQAEVERLQHTAYQLGTILRGYISLQRESQTRLDLQADVRQLLNQIRQLAAGDLTVKATTDSEVLQEIANFFNAIANNLRQTIAQIQANAQQIDLNLSDNQAGYEQLKAELTSQAHQLIVAFSYMEQITNSIQEVAESAGIAATTANLGKVQAESGQANLNMAREDIAQLQEIIRGVTDNIKQIDNSSQKMSRIISIVGQLNLRTSILNRNLEDRLPQEEQLRAIIQEEKGSIQQSVVATNELGKISETIKTKLVEVLRDLEVGTAKITSGDRLTAETNKNLEQVTTATQDTQMLLQSIVNTIHGQIQSGQKVLELRQSLDLSTGRTSNLNERTVASLNETVSKLENLQTLANSFKIEPPTKSE